MRRPSSADDVDSESGAERIASPISMSLIVHFDPTKSAHRFGVPIAIPFSSQVWYIAMNSSRVYGASSRSEPLKNPS